MKFFTRDNFETFSFALLKTRFFYKFSYSVHQNQLSSFEKPVFKVVSIPFSKKFFSSKSIVNYYNFMRSSFYALKLFKIKPTAVRWFKNYYSFQCKLVDSKKISCLISFFKKFRRKNYKLFFRFYLGKNRRIFSFYLRDSHIFSGLVSRTFDYYNWQNRVILNFAFSNQFIVELKRTIIFEVLGFDFQSLLLYQYFNFSNKKIANL